MIITAAEILAFVGATTPTTADTDFAALLAEAITEGFHREMDLPEGTDPAIHDLEPEVQLAARYAAQNAWHRRDAALGSTGYIEPTTGVLVRWARDYVAEVRPILARYSSVAGLVA